ncbi:hypothetical protein VITU9109_03002 [Vibrio tubiashii ATCC 19109]|uniref:Uncharacterized protein n=1 Tax=Vibrio tubiashii ATCC 19109 TaxID=1051646 RepID=A0ABN0DKM1_9VIBR|nr:hypothetical protein VITU9109_03002 [Vibrio tubiashii ATCC 19109]
MGTGCALRNWERTLSYGTLRFGKTGSGFALREVTVETKLIEPMVWKVLTELVF